CDGTFAVEQVRRRRVAPCPGCGAWLAGIDQMSDVSATEWERRPTFVTVLPESFVWDSQCACCDQPAAREIEVKTIPMPGSPLPVALITKIKAPVCAKHSEPHKNLWLHRKSEDCTT